MNKHCFKKLSFLLALIGITMLLGGCAYYDTSFSFSVKGDYMSDKSIDLLLPIEESDELYTDYNEYDDKLLQVPADSDIVLYSKDGFKSMLMHMKGAYLSRFVRDSEGYPDYHKEYSGQPDKISLCINLPVEWRYAGNAPDEDETHIGHDPYGEEAFLEFCDKYKKCRIAVFDSSGTILYVSNDIPLKSSRYYYINGSIQYDPENGYIKQSYTAPPEMLIVSSIAVLLQILSIIAVIVILCVFFTSRKRNGSNIRYKRYLTAAAITNIPTVIILGLMIINAANITVTAKDSILHLAESISLPWLILVLCNIGTLVYFLLQYDKQKKSADNT